MIHKSTFTSFLKCLVVIFLTCKYVNISKFRSFSLGNRVFDSSEVV